MNKGKIETAIEFLNDGFSFKIEGIRLSLENKFCLEVAGWSSCSRLDAVTRLNSKFELDKLKSTFQEMLENSDALFLFCKDKEIKYVLYYDDYGKVSITIVSEENNIQSWSLKLD